MTASEENVTFPIPAAWEASGLSLGAFSDLVDGLVAADLAYKTRSEVTFWNLEAAALVLARRPRRRR